MISKARFSKAIDSQFVRLGRNAAYVNPLSNPLDILVIARRPEQLFELGEGHMHAENPQLEFRVSEVSSPVAVMKFILMDIFIALNPSRD